MLDGGDSVCTLHIADRHMVYFFLFGHETTFLHTGSIIPAGSAILGKYPYRGSDTPQYDIDSLYPRDVVQILERKTVHYTQLQRNIPRRSIEDHIRNRDSMDTADHLLLLETG